MLQGFASEHGPRFYGLPLNEDEITLQRERTIVPEALPAGGDRIVPFHAGETLNWKIVEV